MSSSSTLYTPEHETCGGETSILMDILVMCGGETLLKVYMYSVDHIYHNNHLILTCKLFAQSLGPLRSALIARSFHSEGHARNPRHAIDCMLYHMGHIEVSYGCMITNRCASIVITGAVQVPSYYLSTAHNTLCIHNGGSVRMLTVTYNGHSVVFYYRAGAYSPQGKCTSAHDRKAMLFVQKYIPALYISIMRTPQGRVLRISRHM